jgi:MYXO-CTERM domain-containing protein
MRLPANPLSGLALVGAALVAGCGADITMTDDLDLTWDFAITLSKFDHDLHTPYVKGAQVAILVSSSHEDDNLAGWTVDSSNPDVFRIDSVAVGEGVSHLIVLDKGHHIVGTGAAEVLVPDRVELEAHGYLIMDRNAEAAVDEARIVQGGTATYLVHYMNGSRELNGNGVLSVDAGVGVVAEPRTTFLFENREWLTLTAGNAGPTSIQLYADGVALNSVPVVVVPETDITDVALLTQSEKNRDNGDWLVALAQAYDAAGRRIFGVEYAWEVDGVAQTAYGDLYRYELKKGLYHSVTATRGAHSDSAMIQGTGFVDSTNRIGCATTAGAGGGAGVLVLAALAFATRRRRNRR